MSRGTFAVGLLVSGLLAGVSGCSDSAIGQRYLFRHQEKTEPSIEQITSGDSKADDRAELTQESRNILKSNRRAASWSSEAAEIESDLGVDR